MTSKTGHVFPGFWYANGAVLLALMVSQWGRFGEVAPHSAVGVKGDHEDAAHDLRQDPAEDEAWRRHEQAHREWESKVAAWQETQLHREQSERAQARRDRVRQDEPYKISHLQSPRPAEDGADVLGNLHRIVEKSIQNRQASAQRVREHSALGSGSAPDTPSQSLDSLLQGMQRQQEREFQERTQQRREFEDQQRMKGQRW